MCDSATAQKNRILKSYLISWYSLYGSILDTCTKLMEKSVCAEHSGRYVVSEREVGFSM